MDVGGCGWVYVCVCLCVYMSSVHLRKLDVHMYLHIIHDITIHTHTIYCTCIPTYIHDAYILLWCNSIVSSVMYNSQIANFTIFRCFFMC